MTSKKQVVIIGAGVSGLSTGIVLLEAGFSVQIIADKRTPNTTSDTAAAFWYPFKAEPAELVDNWAKETYEEIVKRHLGNKQSGCLVKPFREISHSILPDPSWKSLVNHYRRMRAEELPVGYKEGYVFDTLVFDSTMYMEYLENLFIAGGGSFTNQRIDDLAELNERKIVINCAGLGARELADDSEVFPSRGQIVSVERNGFNEPILDKDNLLLIVPRVNDIVIGATVGDNETDILPDAAQSKEMLDKVKTVFPEFDWTKIKDEKVGLRPGRSRIRLELEKKSDNILIHNYGHGGSGYTVSWGCSREVLNLLNAELA